MYDPLTKKWSPIASMSVDRYGAAAIVHSGLIYVIGGRVDYDNILDTIEVYDPKLNRWSLSPIKLPVGRYKGQIVLFDY